MISKSTKFHGDCQQAILEFRLLGFTYQQVGNVLGVSRQRIQQLIAPSKKVRDLVLSRALGCCEICGAEVDGSAHVHHLSLHTCNYNNLENLELLCVSCHSRLHNPWKMRRCATCGTRLPKYVYTKYCSEKCQTTAWVSAHYIKVTCVTCGKVFSRQKSCVLNRYTSAYQWHKRTDRYFCSKKCQGTWFGNNHGKYALAKWREQWTH